ncbi:MAG: hypothetical protein HRF43_17415 [Phycisphaerae bacterium]|jgi:hypothetical protein
MEHSTPRGEYHGEHTFRLALHLTKRRLKGVWAAVAVGLWVLGTLLYVAVFVVGDHGLSRGVPAPAAAVLRLLYWVSTAGWFIVSILVPLIRRIHDLYAARLIERSHPEFRNTLVDAVQLVPRAELPGSVRAAILDRASREVDQADLSGSISTAGLRRLAWMNTAVLAAFLLYGLMAPKSVWISAARALGAHLPPPTWTTLAELTPADSHSVLRGEPVRFAARLVGRAPGQVEVRFSLDGGATWADGQRLSLRPPSDESRALWQAVKDGADVQHSMLWQVVAGDAVSPLRRLEVRDWPEIASVRVRLDYPPYTRLAPATQPTGDIDALAGTRATVTAVSRVPVRDPILVTGSPPAELRRVLRPPAPHAPCEITADWIITADDGYHFEFTDTHGQAVRNPIRWSIRARPDLAPMVEVRRPREPIEADPSDAVEVVAHAHDDFGLTRAAIAYRRPGETSVNELPLPMTRAESADGADADVHARLELARLNAAPGEVIEWWVSAWDNREDTDARPAWQRGDSDVHRVTIRRPAAVASAEKNRSVGKNRSAAAPAGPAATKPADPRAGRVLADASKERERMADRNSDQPESESPPAGRPVQAPSPDARPPEAAACGATDSTEAESTTSTRPPTDPAPPDAGIHPADRESASGRGRDSVQTPSPQQGEGSVEDFARNHVREIEKLEKHFADKAATRPAARPGEANQTAHDGQPAPAVESHQRQRSEPDSSGDRLPSASPDPQSRAGRDAGNEGRSDPADGTDNATATRPAPDRPVGRGDADSQRPRVQAPGHSAGRPDDSGESLAHAPDAGSESGDSANMQRGGAPSERDTSGSGSEDSEAGRGATSSAREATPGAPAEGNRPVGGTTEPNSRLPRPASGSTTRPADAQGPRPSQQPGGDPSEPSAPPSTGRDAAPETQDTDSGQADARRTMTSSQRRSEDQTQNQTQGEGPNVGGDGAEGSRPGQERAESQRQEPAEAPSQPQGQGRGEPQSTDGAPGSAANQQPGQGQGREPSRGQRSAEGQGVAEGQRPAESQGTGQGQGSERSEGEASGRQGGDVPGEKRSGQGQGQGQGQNDGQRQTEGGGAGQGRGADTGQTVGPGQGQSQGETKAEGQGQADASGQGQGRGQAQSQGASGDMQQRGGIGGPVVSGPLARLPDKPAAAEGSVRPPPTAERQAADLHSTGRLDALMDALERDLRGGEVDPALLADLGWTPPQARQFVEAYKRAKAAGQRQSSQTRLPDRREADHIVPGGGEPAGVVKRAGPSIAPSARALNAQHSRAPDDTRELLEVGRQRVAPRYQSVLEAYYRSLATQPARR